MPTDFINKITLASALHDIGKVGISDNILLKPGSLTTEEFTIIKSHTTLGAKMLADSTHATVQMAEFLEYLWHYHPGGTATGHRCEPGQSTTDSNSPAKGETIRPCQLPTLVHERLAPV